MSDTRRTSPAIGLWEFDSIAQGVSVADAIAKGAPVAMITTGTAHPGKYIVLVAGDVASVSVAVDIVRDIAPDTLVDRVFLADIAPAVADAIATAEAGASASAEAVGIVETISVASAIEAADAAIKEADVGLGLLRLADGLGGKAFFIVDGSIGDVESAVAAALDRVADRIVSTTVIHQLTDEIRADLASSSFFGDTVFGRAGSK
ncbi:MAG: BMC domain-containing protein [Actinomycetota bacterium]|nr:BMC domain-containing protein [Actinomycetota bacterium]